MSARLPEAADYIVVGAGSAGAAVAARLSEDPSVSVLLLGAGPVDRPLYIHVPAAFSKLFRGRYDWNYDTVPQPELEGRTVFWPRGKTLGGSSSLNAMMWIRGFAADYDEWAESAGDRWSWEHLAPYFRRVERTDLAHDPSLGTIGPQWVERQSSPQPHTAAFLDAARELGYPVTLANDPHDQGFSETMLTTHRGRRASTADTYLRPAARRRNLRVVTGAHARRVIVRDGRAVGVELSVRGSIRRVIARREVVLSGGSVNTPQLLMLSGIGPADHLRDHGIDTVVDAPEVGANLQDHLVAGLAPEATGRTLFHGEELAPTLQWLTRHRGMLTSNVAEGYGFVRTGVADRTQAPAGLPDIEIIFAAAPYVGEGLVPLPGDGITVGAILLRPRSRGTVTLASADPLAKAVIDPRYLSDPDGLDADTLSAGLRVCDALVGTQALGAVTTGRWIQPENGENLTVEQRVAGSLRAYSHTLYHPVGTARMGADAASVVDPELRVRGVDGLRVADASVMPVIIRGHTNAPTIVIGEVAADLIAGR